MVFVTCDTLHNNQRQYKTFNRPSSFPGTLQSTGGHRAAHDGPEEVSDRRREHLATTAQRDDPRRPPPIRHHQLQGGAQASRQTGRRRRRRRRRSWRRQGIGMRRRPERPQKTGQDTVEVRL